MGRQLLLPLHVIKDVIADALANEILQSLGRLHSDLGRGLHRCLELHILFQQAVGLALLRIRLPRQLPRLLSNVGLCVRGVCG